MLKVIENTVPKSNEIEIWEEQHAWTPMREEAGRYLLTIPLKEESTCLGHSKNAA